MYELLADLSCIVYFWAIKISAFWNRILRHLLLTFRSIIMTEITIKDEDLTGLKGKVVIVTGMYLVSTKRSIYLISSSRIAIAGILTQSRYFIGNRAHNCRVPPLPRSIRCRCWHQPSRFTAHLSWLPLRTNKRSQMGRTNCFIQESKGATWTYWFRLRQRRRWTSSQLLGYWKRCQWGACWT